MAGDLDGAEQLFMTAIETLAAIPIVLSVAAAVEGLAAWAAARGDHGRAARLPQLAAALLDGSRSVKSVPEALA